MQHPKNFGLIASFLERKVSLRRQPRRPAPGPSAVCACGQRLTGGDAHPSPSAASACLSLTPLAVSACSPLLSPSRGARGLRPRPPGPRGRSSGLGNPGRAECRASPEPALGRGGQRPRRPGVGSGGRGVLTRALWASVAFFQDAGRSDLSRALCWSVYADVSDAKPGTRSAGPRSRQTDLHGAPMFDPHLAPDPARAVPLSAPGSPSAG